MNPLEHRLRQRIDTLTDERDLARDLLQQARERPRFRRCAFCGDYCYGYACYKHRDLVQREAG